MSSTIPNPATTDWVPISARAANLIYRGGWANGVTYNDGDIVIGSDGLTYVCVKDGTTGAPIPWSSSILPSKPTYGTTLPASPIDGQEAILVDSITASSWQWRFRYNASSTSAFKWEYIGGTSLHVDYDAGTTTSSGSGADLSGPYVTLPRSGQYFAAIGAAASPNAAGAANASINLANQAGTIMFGAVMSLYNQPTGGYYASMARSIRPLQGNAGDVWKTLYSVSNAVSVTFQSRWVDIWPAKVS